MMMLLKNFEKKKKKYKNFVFCRIEPLSKKNTLVVVCGSTRRRQRRRRRFSTLLEGAASCLLINETSGVSKIP